MKKYVIKGKDEKEILKKVSAHFNVPITCVKYEIVSKDKSFLGKVKEITMKVWLEKEEKVSKINPNVNFGDISIKSNKKINDCSEKFKFEILKNGIFLTVSKDVETNSDIENELMKEIMRREIKKPKDEKIKLALTEKKGKV